MNTNLGFAVIFVLFALIGQQLMATQVLYEATNNGFWNAASTWSPQGVPTMMDDADIGTPAYPEIVVTLDAHAFIDRLELGYLEGSTGTIDLSDFHLNANTLQLGGRGGVGHVARNTGRFSALDLNVLNENSLIMTEDDVLTNSLTVSGPGAMLTMGGNLLLDSIIIRGKNTIFATIDAQSSDIDCRTLQIGFDGLGSICDGPGQLLNQGRVNVENLYLYFGSHFSFGPDDTATEFILVSGSGTTLGLHPNTQTNNLAINGGAHVVGEPISPVVKDGTLSVSNAGSSLTLNADLCAATILVRGNGTQVATIDAQGFNIECDVLDIGFDGLGGQNDGPGQLLNQGQVTVGDLRLYFGSHFTFGPDDTATNRIIVSGQKTTVDLHPNTITQDLRISGATVETETTSPVFPDGAITMEGGGSTLVLNTDIQVASIYARGSGSTFATIDANGFDIVCNGMQIGHDGLGSIGDGIGELINGKTIDIDGGLILRFGSELPRVSNSLTVTNVSTDTADTFTIDSGIVNVGSFSGSDVNHVGGTMRPFGGTNLTTINENYNLNGGGLHFDVSGENVGTDYGSFNVIGDLTIMSGGLTIDQSNGFQYEVGQEFLLVNVGGTRTGTFDGLPEGGTVQQVGDVQLVISYMAGDGNDIGISVQPADNTGNFNFTSSSFCDAVPIAGSVQQQLNEINTGPPARGFGSVNRKSDFHLVTSFDCDAGNGDATTVTGDLNPPVSPPGDLTDNQQVSNSMIQVYTEVQRMVLASDLLVDATEADVTYGGANGGPPGGVIPSGRTVTSHCLHFDTTSNDVTVVLSGTIHFESDVLGVIISGDKLNATDDNDPLTGPQLGSSGTIYPTDTRRAWEIGGNDAFFTIAADRRSVQLQGRVGNFLDQMRIVTVATPNNIGELSYVSPNQFITGVDEVTFDSCSSAWYRFTFELPNNAINISLTGITNVDDAAVAYLNGNRITALLDASDLGIDRVDPQGLALLSWPTTDSFAASDDSLFQPGTNELVFGVLGDLSPFDPTGVEFAASVNFEKGDGIIGDVNQDGEVNLLDVQPFVERLVANEYQYEADINGDGAVDLLDVAPFVELLSGG